jgi:hypothetical protein
MELRTEARHQLGSLEGNPVAGLIPVRRLVTEDEQIEHEAAETRATQLGISVYALRTESLWCSWELSGAGSRPRSV